MYDRLAEIVFPLPQPVVMLGWFRVRRSLFSPRQCGDLVRFAEEQGRYYRSRKNRDVAICYVRPKSVAWAFEKMAATLVKENVWGFLLSGIVEPMRIQKYDRGGYTNPHSDFDYSSLDQSKITAIVPLVKRDSWSGGQLSVAGTSVRPLEQGDCVLFPSFARHAVSRVKKGTRIVLSAWAAGPRLV
jgi:hypothetical protein